MPKLLYVDIFTYPRLNPIAGLPNLCVSHQVGISREHKEKDLHLPAWKPQLLHWVHQVQKDYVDNYITILTTTPQRWYVSHNTYFGFKL